MIFSKTKHGNKWLLPVIIALIAISRLIGLGFELPIIGSIPDEDYYVKTILKAFTSGSLHIDFYTQPSLFFYLNLFAFTLFYWLLQALMFIFGLRDILLPVVQENLFFIILFFGRLLSALFGVLTCLLLFRIAGRLFSDRFSPWLVLLLAVFNYQFIIYSHLAKMDMLQAFLVLLSADLALTFQQRNSWRYYYLAVVLAGLAAGTKMIGGAALFFPGFFLLERAWREKKAGMLLAHGLLGILTFAATFLATTPFIIYDTGKAAWTVNYIRTFANNPQLAYLYQDKLPRFISNISHLFTWPELLIGTCGLLLTLFAAVRRKRFDWLGMALFSLVFFVLGYLLVFFDSRYYLPAAPFFIMLIVAGGRTVLNYARLKKIQAVFWALILISPLIQAGKTMLILARPTTQIISHNFAKSLPPEIPFAFELLCGINNSTPGAFFSFSLGHTPYHLFRKAGYAFLVHNRNMYDMYFSMPSGIRALPEIYESYNLIRKNSLRMKTIRRRPVVDFLNPPIDYLKFVDRKNKPADNHELSIRGRINNGSDHKFLVVAGNTLLASVRPGRSTVINRTFKVDGNTDRAIFIFAPVFDKETSRADNRMVYNLDISLKMEERVFQRHLSGLTAVNEPVVVFLGEVK